MVPSSLYFWPCQNCTDFRANNFLSAGSLFSAVSPFLSITRLQVVHTDKQKTLMPYKHQIDNTDVCLSNSVLVTNPKQRYYKNKSILSQPKLIQKSKLYVQKIPKPTTKLFYLYLCLSSHCLPLHPEIQCIFSSLVWNHKTAWREVFLSAVCHKAGYNLFLRKRWEINLFIFTHSKILLP